MCSANGFFCMKYDHVKVRFEEKLKISIIIKVIWLRFYLRKILSIILIDHHKLLIKLNSGFLEIIKFYLEDEK